MDSICQHDLLTQVEKPARYAGNEWNIIVKNHNQMDVTFALAFPDVYEVGMSFLGYKILYHIINKRDTLYAERVFAPWVDMEQKMRDHHQALKSLETKTPIKDFDFVSFTLQYEMSYTNILNMLDLSDIPMYAKDRTEEHPFVIGGGPCVFNPEPIADFFDFFVIGEGEEAVIDIGEMYKTIKEEEKARQIRFKRSEVLFKLAQIQGVYVPAFYDVAYADDGKIASITPNRSSIPEKVQKRVLADLDATDYPDNLVVPFLQIIHDRVMLEIQRGCTRGCRFCQAGMVYRPVRERKKETLRKIARTLVDKTGYDEISLTSLASNDYSQIEDLIHELMEEFKKERISISLPSLRADKFSVKLAEELQQMRKSGLTFAPEAGSQRLRDAINKNVDDEQLIDAVTSAFQSGYKQVKLYFMLGLPTETDEDVVGIAELAEKVVEAYRAVHKGRTSGLKVTVSTSLFTPKPHTPFQWVGQVSKQEMKRRRIVLQNAIRSKAITYNWHDPKVSFLEAAISRGDRRLSKVIWQAWKNGCKYDSWSEHFRNDEWLRAYEEVEIDPEWYTYRNIDFDDIVPWEHISSGVSKDFLELEYRRALEGKTVEDCRISNCTGCGVCPTLGVDVVVWKEEDQS